MATRWRFDGTAAVRSLRGYGDKREPPARAAELGYRCLDAAVVDATGRWVVYELTLSGLVQPADDPSAFRTNPEGPPAYEGSGIRHQSHVQIAVRNPACVVGVFRPTITP